MKNFIYLFLKRPPIVFPIISIFLLFFAITDMVEWFGNPDVLKIMWLRPLPIVLYALLWLGATFFKRWAAVGFVIFTVIHLACFIFLKESQLVGRLLDNFMVAPVPLSLIFSFIILIYYRKIK